MVPIKCVGAAGLAVPCFYVQVLNIFNSAGYFVCWVIARRTLRCLDAISGAQGLHRHLDFSRGCAVRVPIATEVGAVLNQLGLVPWEHRVRG